MSITEQERKVYELYLMAQTDEERQEAINKLIPGSYPFYYLYFLDLTKRVGSKLTEKDRILMETFSQKYPYQSEKQKIDIRLLLLQYDDAETQQAKEGIIQQIQGSYLNHSFNHFKPEDFSRQSDSMSSQDEDEEPTAQPSEDPFAMFTQPHSSFAQPKKNLYEYEQIFSKRSIMQILSGWSTSEPHATNMLNSLPQGYEFDIDFVSMFPPVSVYNWACSVGSRIADLHSESFMESLKLYFNSLTASSIDRRLCTNMTITQLDYLASKVPFLKEDKNFVGAYFQKHFHEELSEENQEFWGIEEKRANLERLYSYAKGKDMPKSLQSSLLIEILEIGVKIGEYSEQYFRDYLEIPLTSQHQVFKQSRVSYGDAHWNDYIGNVQTQNMRGNQWDQSQNQIFSKYLEHFCFLKENLDSFKDDFSAQYLQEIEEKVKIYNSDGMNNLTIDLKKYQQIADEVKLSFIESNKESFAVEEEVSLSLEIKNIQTLYVKTFEFNTETYYKKTLMPFDTNVNLDGLVASHEQKYEYTQPPNKKIIEKFTFPELTGKIGLFIAEFIGNGMSARAIIKKGSLSILHKPTIAGHLVYVLDENRAICKGSNTGLYFDGQYYPADPDRNGKVFIPYGKAKFSSKAILMNNGFAQLSDFERGIEQYEFKALFAVNHESILIGNKAQIMVRPILKINNRQAGVELLKHSVITLTTTNYIDNTPITKKFENLAFKNDRELIIDFQVPPYLESISVSLQTDVNNITMGKVEKFTAQQNFKVTTHQSGVNMCELFLRKEGQNHIVYVLGKNGEPKPNASIKVQVVNLKYQQLLPVNEQVLTTNKEGMINLGHIRHKCYINISATLINLQAKYFINPIKQQLNYQDTIETIEGESLEFPIFSKSLSRKRISLLKLQGPIILEDLYEKLSFQESPTGLNKISVDSLPVGEYQLNLKKVGKIINIVVHRGTQWEAENFILKRNCLFENRVASKMVKVSEVKGNNIK